MDMVDLGKALGTPSCLLGGFGVGGNLLLIPHISMRMSELEEQSRLVPLDFLDDTIRLGRYPLYRVLSAESKKKHSTSYGCIRLMDPAGSVVECIGFAYDEGSRMYFCELRLDFSRDAIRWLSVEAMCTVPHTLLPVRVIGSLYIDP